MAETPGSVLIAGQGLAGSAVAWQLHLAGLHPVLIDRADGRSASRIAAGLLTPVTGNRLTWAPEFTGLLAQAADFYRQVEVRVNRRLFAACPAIRRFVDDDERRWFLTERWPQLQDRVALITDESGTTVGFEMPQAARLRVAEYLDATASYFRQRDQFVCAELDVANDVIVSDHRVRIPRLGLSADFLVFCQGWQPGNNPWFPGIPDAPNKGEILFAELPGYHESRVLHQGLWIVPEDSASGDSKAPECGSPSTRCLIGATYDRTDFTPEPTPGGLRYLLDGLKPITSAEPVVLGHFAGIRAGMTNRRPVAMFHAKYPQLAIVNGLGSRGSLLAPSLATHIVRQIIEPASPDKIPATSRRKSLTALAHSIVRRALHSGDLAIDATAGNGYDTLMLADCTGTAGQVIAIDIQPSAIEATRQRLADAGFHHAVLKCGNHADILRNLVEEPLRAGAVMFNLGYLPGSDKSCTTQPDSTCAAVRAACSLLRPGGVLTILAYRGHAGGASEAQALADQLPTMTNQEYRTDYIESDPGNAVSPVLWVVRRNAGT